ncbi:MAG: hypothetical protein IJ618_10255 [Prevotella sp.]|nr:hypothetical protein [Prevotella sp.]
MKKILLSFALSIFCFSVVCAQDGAKLEAEDAVYENCELVEGTQYSGGKAIAMKEGNGKITFKYNAAEGGKYTVYVGYDCPKGWGAKVFDVSVRGNKSSVQTKADKAEEVEVGTFIMNAGENTVEITPNWTWYLIDYIRIASGSSSTVEFDIAAIPVDSKATEAAKKVYTFLYDNFGKKTISGIMTGDMEKANGDVTQHEDVQAVYKASGRYPALVGFDFLNATGKGADGNDWSKGYTDKSVALAKDLYRRGGIPAFTWHWCDPARETSDFYANEQAKEKPCTTKISQAMNADGSWNTASDLYKNMVKDIHTVADYFLQLQEAGVACIFRPLHEASGGWFWWGTDGGENCAKLYQLIFDEMVNKKGVHNVIWVWNPNTVSDADWNPGATIFDVISIDIYNKAGDYSSNYATFDKLKAMSEGKKLIALSENGPIPDIEKEIEEEAVWSWWMPWYQSWGGKYVDQTSAEEWKKCMEDNRVVTLEDLSEGWGTFIDTAIKSLKAAETTSRAIYDLQGRRLSEAEAPAKGIYVQDGKKFVIK